MGTSNDDTPTKSYIMKRKLYMSLSLVVLLLSAYCVGAQVKISDTTGSPEQPIATSVLELESINKGFLPPRLTSAQRDAITDPFPGLMIYNVEEGCQNFFNGASWQKLCGTCTPEVPPATAGGNQLNVSGTSTQLNATPPSIGNGQWSIISGHGGELANPSQANTTFTGLSGFSYQLRWTTSTLCGSNSSDITVSFAFECGQAQVPVTFYGNTVYYGTVSYAGFCWLDRNLGATQVAQSLEDSLARGYFFQWGRCADGHEYPLSPVLGTQATSACPGDSTFRANGNTNWSNNTTSTLWAGNSVNNPCPSGWRVPTSTEFLQPEQVGGWQNMQDAFDSPLKFPVTGTRLSDSGGVLGAATFISLWTATATSSTAATRQRYQAAGISHNSPGKSFGYPVRCIRD